MLLLYIIKLTIFHLALCSFCYSIYENVIFYDGVDIRTGGSREAINGATANKTLVTTDGRMEVEREISISGGEINRLDAYFDQNKKLQIFASLG